MTVLYTILALCAIGLTIFGILSEVLDKRTYQSAQVHSQKLDEYIEITDFVIKNSEWFRNVQRLNAKTDIFASIPIDGDSYTVEVDSRAKYDRISLDDALREFVSIYRDEVEETLKRLHVNQKNFNEYQRNLRACYVEIPEETCDKLGVPQYKFEAYERRMVEQISLKIRTDCTVTCNISYRSPAGRKHERKYQTYTCESLEHALNEIKEHEDYLKSKEYAHQKERSKMTKSLRYDIMYRDGFRCCICGRTAQDGVELEVDHIVPVSKGGETEPQNLQTLCRDCNRGKSAKYMELDDYL